MSLTAHDILMDADLFRAAYPGWPLTGRELTDYSTDPAFAICYCVHCDRRITGTPVVDPEDRSERKYCSDGCRTSGAEAAQEQWYPGGVAT